MIPLIFFGSMILIFVVIPVFFIARSVNKTHDHFDKNGITTDAIVIDNVGRRKRHSCSTHYTTRVVYLGSDGQEHKSELFHSDGIDVGTRIKIRYVPGEYKTVLHVN